MFGLPFIPQVTETVHVDAGNRRSKERNSLYIFCLVHDISESFLGSPGFERFIFAAKSLQLRIQLLKAFQEGRRRGFDSLCRFFQFP